MAENCVPEGTMADLNEEFEVNLIEAVKQQKCIYDKKHPKYGRKPFVGIAWNKISKFLGESTTNCMNKWYSLLQTFLHYSRFKSTSDQVSDWLHYKTFKEIQPLMVENYVELFTDKSLLAKLTKTQKENLLNELELNSQELFSKEVNNCRPRQIWIDITNKLNEQDINSPLLCIQWQKAWWDLKQGILNKLGTRAWNKNIVNSLSLDEKSILRICGMPSMEEDQIKAKLESYAEFNGSDHLRCKQLRALKGLKVEKDLSETPMVMCNLCMGFCATTKYDVASWSATAKRLIPVKYRQLEKLLVCQYCEINLKSKASVAWKICRLCAKESENLQNLLSSSFQKIRKTLYVAAKYTLSKSDGLPCFVCFNCVDKLLTFRKIYESFVAAQVMLQAIHDQKFVGEIEIKRKPLRKSTINQSNKKFKPEGKPVDNLRNISYLSQARILNLKYCPSSEADVKDRIGLDESEKLCPKRIKYIDDINRSSVKSDVESSTIVMPNICSLNHSSPEGESMTWQTPDFSNKEMTFSVQEHKDQAVLDQEQRTHKNHIRQLDFVCHEATQNQEHQVTSQNHWPQTDRDCHQGLQDQEDLRTNPNLNQQVDSTDIIMFPDDKAAIFSERSPPLQTDHQLSTTNRRPQTDSTDIIIFPDVMTSPEQSQPLQTDHQLAATNRMQQMDSTDIIFPDVTTSIYPEQSPSLQTDHQLATRIRSHLRFFPDSLDYVYDGPLLKTEIALQDSLIVEKLNINTQRTLAMDDECVEVKSPPL